MGSNVGPVPLVVMLAIAVARCTSSSFTNDALFKIKFTKTLAIDATTTQVPNDHKVRYFEPIVNIYV